MSPARKRPRDSAGALPSRPRSTDGHKARGRPAADPALFAPILTAYLQQAEDAARGPARSHVPLDFKSIARAIGCSHNHFFHPNKHPEGWKALKASVEATRKKIADIKIPSRRSCADRLEQDLADTRAELSLAKDQLKQSWQWLMELERAFMNDGIDLEKYVPRGLRDRLGAPPFPNAPSSGPRRVP